MDSNANPVQPAVMARDRETYLLLACLFLFLAPAVVSLAGQTWQSEAGSLAPLILCLGGWTLWQTVRINADVTRPGSLRIWAMVMVPALAAYLLACAINMVAAMALSAWLGFAASFYAMFGASMVRICLVPLIFLGLIVPLPYSLSVQGNTFLRSWISEQATVLAHAGGLDVAQGEGFIAVGQYLLAVETACAGASSTMSLVAIGLLFAYWIGNARPARAIAIAVLAVPIALAANVLRVVVLLLLVSNFGASILDTIVHPLSGVVSFCFAAAMLAMTVRLLPGRRKDQRGAISLTAAA